MIKGQGHSANAPNHYIQQTMIVGFNTPDSDMVHKLYQPLRTKCDHAFQSQKSKS